MNQYTDIQVIECNRLHSEEAKSNNNENFALWQNNLTDIVQLEAGDRVSVHGAMVSERGAGQANSIEIKGESLGITKTFGTIQLSKHTTSESVAKTRIDNSDETRATYVPETKEIFDNKGYFIANYFIPANGHNYIDLPRRWWYGEIDDDIQPGIYQVNYTAADNQSKGMSLADPFGMLDAGLPDGLTEPDRWDLYDDFYQIPYVSSNASLSKLKKDNARYTIMVREYTYYSQAAAQLGTTSEYKIPPQYLRTPEHHTYRIYRELKELDFPIGFNTPEFIAEDVTRQIQKVESTNLFDYRGDSPLPNEYTPGFPIHITKSISTETFKPFNVAGYLGESDSTDNVPQNKMNEFLNASTDLSDGWEYLSQFGVIACKRPELYEFGRLINRKNNLQLALTAGSHITEGTYGDVYHTNLPYNNINVLNDFKNFIQVQEKYPEVYNIFSDPRTLYDDGDNINNCRWVHINRYKNASMTLHTTGSDAEQFDTATLGHGGYSLPPWNASSLPMKSMILPIEYDPSQRDTYYEYPDENAGERTYGCFGRSAANKIIIYGTKNNGSGSALLQAIYDDGAIEEERKIGFDQHFSAPGMAYLLPSDLRPDPAQIMDANDHTEQIYRNGGDAKQTDFTSGGSVEVAQLYLGANAPQVGWNGENFTLSGLHTAMNKGNNFLAANPTAQDLFAYSRDAQGESDVVYKINPREDYCDFSPARKPYVANFEIKGYSAPLNTISGARFNANLEPWRVYDCLTGIMIEDFGLSESEWTRSIWGLMGFSYKQFHSATNTRLSVIDYTNINDLSIITTNSEINEGDTKIYTQNMWGVPLFYNRLPFGGTIKDKDDVAAVRYLPEIIQKTQSVTIVADNLPTKMIRGYYTIRSNILQGTPFIGGKINNTTMPIIGIVNKINGDGDFYFQEESSLVFTVTKPLRLASLTTSIHDPDGSYARCSEQSTVLIKVQKNRNVTYNILEEIIQEQQGNQKQRL